MHECDSFNFTEYKISIRKHWFSHFHFALFFATVSVSLFLSIRLLRYSIFVKIEHLYGSQETISNTKCKCFICTSTTNTKPNKIRAWKKSKRYWFDRWKKKWNVTWDGWHYSMAYTDILIQSCAHTWIKDRSMVIIRWLN